VPTVAAASFSRCRALGTVVLGGLVLTLSGCHALKTQLGMNAGAATSSATTSSSSAAGSGQSSSGGKKVHLGGGGDKGPPGLIETLGRAMHADRESSSLDATSGVTAPRFRWGSRAGAARGRPG
jgi:hypothetical protein